MVIVYKCHANIHLEARVNVQNLWTHLCKTHFSEHWTWLWYSVYGILPRKIYFIYRI